MHPLQSLFLVLGVAALGLLLAGWVAYPIALGLFRRPAGGPGGIEPGAPHPLVDVIIATRESGAAVRARVADALGAEYPAERLRVIVALDAASPTPPAAMAEALKGMERVTVVAGDGALGKAAALNAAVRTATGDVLVFSDVAQRFDPVAISRLVECLASSGAAGASGYLRARGDRGALGWFWKYETLVRRLESDYDSLVGVTGAVYALRRDAWHDLRPGLINDDLAVPLLARKAGFRVVHCGAAVAEDHRDFHREQQYQRRVRTLTGVYQLLAWYPWVGSPRSNPLWVQFLLHKGVRLATPYLAALAGLGIIAAVGWRVPLAAALLAEAAVVVVALGKGVGLSAVVAETAWALRLMLVAPIEATRNALRANWDVWRAPDRGGADGG